MPIDPEILADGEPWNVSKSHHAIQQYSNKKPQKYLTLILSLHLPFKT